MIKNQCARQFKRSGWSLLNHESAGHEKSVNSWKCLTVSALIIIFLVILIKNLEQPLLEWANKVSLATKGKILEKKKVSHKLNKEAKAEIDKISILPNDSTTDLPFYITVGGSSEILLKVVM